ncbi:MAG: hypothetical protein ABFS45_20845 [Pseudomonadota bacterium]
MIHNDLVAVILSVVLGLLMSLTAQAQESINPTFHAGGHIAEFRECRFLSLGSSMGEQRRELSAEKLDRLFSILRTTRIGSLVVSELKNFQREGLGGERSNRLRFFEIQRDLGPSAEYFESGELHINSRFFRYLGLQDDTSVSRLHTAVSFLVHEGVHAIAHHLNMMSRYDIYQADTKVNEALAYFIQGLFLDEIKEQHPNYQEVKAIPAWDVCTARIVKILASYGITAETSFEEAYDLLSEWQLEVDEATALRLSKLWHYYQFIHDSEESAVLWRMDEDRIPKIKVVEAVTDMIWLDVERRNCNFTNTFSLMTNRIILYSPYAETPTGVTPCAYFTGFVRSLRTEGEVSKVLREEIDRWLRRRGIDPQSSVKGAS